MTKFKKSMLLAAGLFVVVTMAADPASANNFSSIAKNMVTSVGSLPSLLAALSYLFGLLLGVLGVMKIKDHVENPGQTPLKDGAIRLAAGGALFAIPMLYEAAKNTIGSGSTPQQASMATLTFQ